MLSVSQSAEMLGISQSRVRALIKTGTLPASKVGRTWLLDEKDVLQRASEKPKAGRPKKGESPSRAMNPDDTEVRQAAGHALYLLCKEYFQYRPSFEIIQNAESGEEASFYMAVADFFLQQRQAELVAKGVY